MKVDFAKLDRAFNPRCVAVVGDKKDAGYRWLKAQNSLKGKLYSVQVAPPEIEGIRALGIENYTSLLDIPEPVDLVIVSVPRAVAPRILHDCIQKNVAAAHPDVVARMIRIMQTARVDVTPPKPDPRIWEKYREDNNRLDALFAQ